MSAERLVALPVVLPDGHPLSTPFVVACCHACSTGFTDDPVAQADFDVYYASDAKYAEEGATAAGEAVSATSVATPWAVANNRQIADHLLELVPEGARILDLGCGVGTLLAELSRRGVRGAIGLDPAPRSAEVAALGGADVRTGTFAAIPDGLGTFDAVTMIGVLEHLWDVDEAIRAVQALLRPGGLLYLDVPDALRYAHPTIVPFQDFNTEHANHFSFATLDLLLGRFGFSPVWHAALLQEAAGDLPPVAAADGAWRWDGAADGEVAITPDPALARELRAFSSESAALLEEFDAHLQRCLAGTGSVAVWGVGELLYKLLALPSLAERELAAAVDGNPSRQGKRIAGVVVQAPDALVGGSGPIVVAAGYAEQSIRRAADRLGLADRLITLPFPRP